MNAGHHGRRPSGEVRVAWQDSRNGPFRWNTFVRASHDGGVTWDRAVDVSDVNGAAYGYLHPRGYDADYGDYMQVAHHVGPARRSRCGVRASATPARAAPGSTSRTDRRERSKVKVAQAMRAELEGMHDTLAPFPVPPRPDLGSGFPPDPDHALGDDFYGPRRAGPGAWCGCWRSSRSICLLAGLVGPPVLHAWESGRKSHEFSFMATLGGEPVRWNPCEPIHYVVNLGAAPAGSLQDVQDAVLRISSATGHRVRLRRAER